MICNRRAFVMATGCPQVSVDLRFPELEYCSNPGYTNPIPCEACTPKMLPEPDINFPGAQKCISFYLTLIAIDPDDESQPITYTNGCFSASIVIPIRLPCFRRILTRSSGNNNGTALIMTVEADGCMITARFSSAFSLAEPTKYMARIKKCIIPPCLNITLTPIVVGYGTHDADGIGGAVVQMGVGGKLNDIELMFPLMCDLPQAAKIMAYTPGNLVRMYWQWNKEQKWKMSVLFPGICGLRHVDVDHPITATCTNGEYRISVLFTRFPKPDPEDFRGSKGQTGQSGEQGTRGRAASLGDIGACPKVTGKVCSKYNDEYCGDFCDCNDKWTLVMDCPFGEDWHVDLALVNLWNMWFTNEGALVASQDIQHYAAFNSCTGRINHSQWGDYADLPTFKLSAPVGVPELED